MAVWYSPGLGVAVRPLTASSSLHFLRDVRGSAVAVCPVNGYVIVASFGPPRSSGSQRRPNSSAAARTDGRSAQGVKVGGQTDLVGIVGHGLAIGRKAIDEVAGDAVLDKGGSGGDADGG